MRALLAHSSDEIGARSGGLVWSRAEQVARKSERGSVFKLAAGLSLSSVSPVGAGAMRPGSSGGLSCMHLGQRDVDFYYVRAPEADQPKGCGREERATTRARTRSGLVKGSCAATDRLGIKISPSAGSAGV